MEYPDSIDIETGTTGRHRWCVFRILFFISIAILTTIAAAIVYIARCGLKRQDIPIVELYIPTWNPIDSRQKI